MYKRTFLRMKNRATCAGSGNCSSLSRNHFIYTNLQRATGQLLLPSGLSQVDGITFNPSKHVPLTVPLLVAGWLDEGETSGSQDAKESKP